MKKEVICISLSAALLTSAVGVMNAAEPAPSKGKIQNIVGKSKVNIKPNTGSTSTSIAPKTKTKPTKPITPPTKTNQPTPPRTTTTSTSATKIPYVDLGLPSGTKWAKYNLGSKGLTDSGSFYAWGETGVKSNYSEDNSETYQIDIDDIAGNPRYDVACKTLGNHWSIPTQEQWNELMNECNWKWGQVDGMYGMTVTGPNYNSIFFPACGYSGEDGVGDKGKYGFYWTSTPNPKSQRNAYAVTMYVEGQGLDPNNRYTGLQIRPVYK